MSSMTTADEPSPTPPEPKPRKTNAVVVVLASIFGLLGVTLLIGGAALIVIHATGRDDDGYYTSGTELVESDGYAITTDEIDLGAEPTGVAPGDIVSGLRLQAESVDGQALFLGIGRTAEVGSYLGEVDRSVVTDFGSDGVKLDDLAGGKPAGVPANEDVWAVQTDGTGRQTLEWDPQSGSWSAVVMNADATRGVATDMNAGADIGWLIWLGLVLAAVGLALTAGCGYALVRAVR